LYTSFNKLETGSTKNISLFLSLWLHHGKTTFHNVDVKLCNLYQVAEVLNDIASYKIFCPSFMFNQVKINCICLMLFLHELKQVVVLFKQFSFINRNVSLKQILFTWFHIFPFSCLQQKILGKALKFSK